MSNVIIQVFERGVNTFWQTFLAVYVQGDLSTADNAAVAGGAAVLSFVKSYVATFVKSGGEGTAALF